MAYGEAYDCAQTLSTAQECVKQCVNIGSVKTDDDGVIYGNLLLECIDQAPLLNRAKHLEDCCGMVEAGPCGASMEDANSCLTTELTNIRTKSLSYLQCIYNAKTTEKASESCVFANFCVNILTGGFGEGYTNDFKVGESNTDNSLAVISRNAQTCGDMDVFGYNACNEVKGCCEPCQDLIAGVAHAVTYDLLLPAYNTDGNFSDCEEKSCDDYMKTTATAVPSGRQLEMEDASTDATMIVDDAAVVEFAGECNDGLAQDIVVYNETFAAGNLFECLYKKMGKIVSETEQTAQGAKESSSVSFLLGATSMAVSAMASAVIAIIA